MFKRIFLVLFFISLFSRLYSANNQWNGGVDENWTTLGNWDTPTTVPGTGDTATFPAVSGNRSILSNNQTVGTIAVTPGATLIEITDGGTFTIESDISITGAPPGANSVLDVNAVNLSATNILVSFDNDATDALVQLVGLTTIDFGDGLTITGPGIVSTSTSPAASLNAGSISVLTSAQLGNENFPLLIDIASQPSAVNVDANCSAYFSYSDVSVTVASALGGNGDYYFIHTGEGELDFSGAPVISTLNGNLSVSLFNQGSFFKISPNNTSANLSIECNEGNILVEETGELQSTVSGTAGIIIDNNSILTVSGSMSYSGQTVINTGSSLVGSATALSSNSNIAVGGFLSFQQLGDATFTPNLDGSGTIFVQTSNGNLILTGDHTFSGLCQVLDGTLQMSSGTMPGGSIEVSIGATFMGVTTINNLTNEGTVAPGNSIGTLTILGDYTQVAGANLEIELSPTDADLLDITGLANLDGTLTLLPENGNYTEGQTFTVIDADGGVAGTFNTVTNNSDVDLSVSYTANTVVLTILNSATVIPIPISQLRGNPKNVADYLYANNFTAPAGSELAAAISALSNQPAQDFRTDLLQVSQLPYLGLTEVNLQNDVRMANLFNTNFKQFCQQKVEKNKKACQLGNQMGVFAQPILYFYHQEAIQGKLSDIGQIPFDAYTYGTSLGIQSYLGTHWNAQLGFGYTHSDVFWKQRYASGYFNTFYVGPSLGWYNPNTFVNLTYVSAFNFYDLYRNIQFGTYKERAHTEHTSYDLLVRLEGGVKHPLEGLNNWFLQPEAQVNYLTFITPAFKESEASDLNLKVYKSVDMYLQPNFKVRLLKEFYSSKLCFSPNIYVGWLANIPVTKKPSKARFKDIQTQRRFFEITGLKETTNQLVLGLQFAVQNCDQFKAGFDFEYDVQDQYQIYEWSARVDWFF